MKRKLMTLSLSLGATTILAQGIVDFYNTSTTLVSSGPAGQETVISGPPGAYYFGLLIAPPGSSQLSQFTFSGLYATNIVPSIPGQVFGGYSVRVPNWVAGTSMSFLVAGWSASLGHDWSPQWTSGVFAGSGEFGLSSIGTGTSGALGAPPLSPSPMFGGLSGIQTGWDLSPVPEPSVLGLWGLAGIISLTHCLRRLRRPGRSRECR
jgi:hypothetical protein